LGAQVAVIDADGWVVRLKAQRSNRAIHTGRPDWVGNLNVLEIRAFFKKLAFERFYISDIFAFTRYREDAPIKKSLFLARTKYDAGRGTSKILRRMVWCSGSGNGDHH